MALNGTESVAIATASGSAVTEAGTTTGAIAALAMANPAPSETPFTNITGTTLTAAAIVGRAIKRTGPTAAFADTFDTAANIIAALPSGSVPSAAWLMTIRSLVPYADTLAGGTGVTLLGETVIPGNSLALFLVQYTGTGAVTITGLGAIPISMGAIAANTNITTAGNGTLTAAGIVGGVITRSGPTAAFSDAIDSAANIVAALPNPNVGQSWELSLTNTSAWPETLTAGTGITLSGLANPIPANSTADFLVTYTGAGAVTLQLVGVAYNAAAGADPATVQTQFGSGTGAFLCDGTLARTISGAGVSPGATGGDYVLAVATIPANSFDGVGNRGVMITAKGSFGATSNSKRIKIIFAPATAVVGSAVSGGTAIEDTQAQTTNGGGWLISANVFKYGAANSNTQIATSNGKIAGASHLGASAPTSLTATENAAILVCITGNAATATSDIVLNEFTVTAID